MEKDVNFLIADVEDENDSKIAKAKETAVPTISTSELYEIFDLELKPSDERLMAELKEEFAEGTDFAGIIDALNSGGVSQFSGSVDICIDMKTGNIEMSHFIERLLIHSW